MLTNLARKQDTKKLSFYEQLFIAMSMVMPLQLYNIGVAGLNISVDRLILMIIIVLYPYYIWTRKMKLFSAQIVSMVGIYSAALSVFSGAGLDQVAFVYFPSMLQSYILFAIGATVIKNNVNAARIIYVILIAWVLIFTYYSIYTLYYYYVIGTTNVPVPFIGYIADYSMHKTRLMRSYRLFLPTATAPFLGALNGFLTVFFFGIYYKFRKRSYLILGFVALITMILTLSRGPIVTLALTFILFLFLLARNKQLNSSKFIVGAISGLLITFLLATYYINYQYSTTGKSSAARIIISEEDFTEGRHLSLRLYSLELFSVAPLKQKIFGQGFGAFSKHGVGSYSFSSYLTLLVEAGILGMFTLILVYSIPLLRAWRYYRLSRNLNWLFIFALTFNLATIHLFYELKTFQLLWLVSSFIYGLTLSNNEIIEESFTYFEKSHKKRLYEI